LIRTSFFTLQVYEEGFWVSRGFWPPQDMGYGVDDRDKVIIAKRKLE
jgi:hypothetical protein